MHLEVLFQPRSIAVIGASEKPTVGRRIVASLDRIGFTGKIYPVNPSYSRAVATWAAMTKIGEASTKPFQRLPHDELYRRVGGCLEKISSRPG